VRGLPGDHYDLAISSAIIGMGKAMKLTVIAEGVETADQLRALKGIECATIQGYFLSRPLPAAACAEFTRQNFATA
jgi:EAL domain-containing protein (putative c-di-GMP-specific phosphodiesterase class I)